MFSVKKGEDLKDMAKGLEKRKNGIFRRKMFFNTVQSV
jgi:hypothetical protein